MVRGSISVAVTCGTDRSIKFSDMNRNVEASLSIKESSSALITK